MIKHGLYTIDLSLKIIFAFDNIVGIWPWRTVAGGYNNYCVEPVVSVGDQWHDNGFIFFFGLLAPDVDMNLGQHHCS